MSKHSDESAILGSLRYVDAGRGVDAFKVQLDSELNFKFQEFSRVSCPLEAAPMNSGISLRLNTKDALTDRDAVPLSPALFYFSRISQVQTSKA